MEKDEIVNIISRFVGFLFITGFMVFWLILAIDVTGGLKTFLMYEVNMFFVNARWGIIVVISTLMMICYFAYDLIKTVNSHKVGKKQLESFILETGKKQLDPFDIHQKNTINELPCFLVMIDETKALIMKRVGYGGVDSNIEKRYRFYYSKQYILAVDKIYPQKIYLFG